MAAFEDCSWPIPAQRPGRTRDVVDHNGFGSKRRKKPRIEAFDLLLSVAIPRNFHGDHYFMFPGTVWRAFETAVLDKEFFKTAMRPVVRFVIRSPVAPEQLDALAAAVDRHADRGAPALKTHLPPAQRRGRNRRD